MESSKDLPEEIKKDNKQDLKIGNICGTIYPMDILQENTGNRRFRAFYLIKKGK